MQLWARLGPPNLERKHIRSKMGSSGGPSGALLGLFRRHSEASCRECARLTWRRRPASVAFVSMRIILGAVSLRAFHFRRGCQRSASRLRSPWATQPPASLRAFLLRRFSHRPRRRTGPRDQSSDSVRGPFFLSSQPEPSSTPRAFEFRALGFWVLRGF